MRGRIRRAIWQLQGRPFRNARYESQYRAAYKWAGVRTGYLFAWLGAMSLGLFSMVEILVHDGPADDVVPIMRGGLGIIFVGIGWHAKVKTHLYRRYFEYIVFALLAIYASSILFVEYRAQLIGHSEFFYLSVTSMCILLTIASYCFMRLSFPFAIASAAFIGLATFATVYLSKVYEVLVAGRMLTYIGLSHVVGLTIRQLFDMRERRIFLQTKRLKNVAALRQRLIEAQAEASHAKTKFLAVLSHEIRTPMNTIVRMMDVIQADIKDHLTDKRVATFKLVAQSCDRLLSTFDEMLEFAQLGSGRSSGPSAKVPFRLGDVLHECGHMVQHQALEKGIALTVHANGLPDIMLLGDPQKLARVVLNLSANAIKFTRHGRVDIHAAIVAERLADVDVEIVVSDSGIGIPPSQLDKIFEPFYQVDSAYARQYEGSGLGLAICRQIMTSLSGQVEAASEVGVGSRFTVRLPLRQAGA